jgi:predicted nucleic acid-binding protein
MLTIDANVWVAAADRNDLFSSPSRAFLKEVARQRLRIFLPTFARVEIACALARRRQSASVGIRLADSMLASAHVELVALDAQFLAHALFLGTRHVLRSGDALYVAAADLSGATLISWDDELMRRTQAQTPSEWFAANSPHS